MGRKDELTEILHRMQSDYIPEHTAATEEFIQKGFSPKVLLAIIKRTPQPNLVSMYFYICGKLSDEKALDAWTYLRYRFELEPEKFDANNSYSPHSLDDDYRYLLFSVRKYFILFLDKII